MRIVYNEWGGVSGWEILVEIDEELCYNSGRSVRGNRKVEASDGCGTFRQKSIFGVNLMTTITLEIPDDLYERLCALAEQTGETVPDLIVRLLTEWYERETGASIADDGSVS